MEKVVILPLKSMEKVVIQQRESMEKVMLKRKITHAIENFLKANERNVFSKKGIEYYPIYNAMFLSNDAEEEIIP